jgi:murein DD-endopeptidase MepM/ murein hydrolase activator NlpD
MSYTDCIARISQLEALVNGSQNWASTWGSLAGLSNNSTTSSATSTQAIDGNSPFAGVLEGLTGGVYVTSAGIAANAAALGASATSGTTSSTVFDSPLPSGRLTQDFGPTSETLEPSATVNGVTYAHYHNGIDLAARLGTAVHAAADGTVTFAGKEKDGAVIVKIRHDDGYVTLYGHLDPSLDVKVGDRVTAGETIGQVGMTGVTTGPHLHFGLYTSGGTAIDPEPSLKAGYLPDPATLMGPSAADPTVLVQESGSAALARFDAVSSKIPYAAEIRSAAIANGIDPLLLTGLVKAESSFHVNSHSGCGAMGLTQLMPGTARSLGVTNPYDAQQNLNGGAKYLARQLKHFGRVDLALAAYNAGPSAIGRLGVVPDSKQHYVSKILKTWASYQEPSL